MDPNALSPKRRTAVITGRGWHVPSDVLTNSDIAQGLDSKLLTEWILQNKWCQEQLEGVDNVDRPLEERAFCDYVSQRIGIEQRHVIDRQAILDGHPSDRKTYASNLGAAACRKALGEAGVVPDDIEVLICSTGSPDRIFPSTATEMLAQLGAKSAHGYDLLAACSGLGYGLHTARALIESNIHQRIMVVAAEYFTSMVNYRDPSSAFFWGDAAAAILVEGPEVAGKKPGLEVIDSFCGAIPSHNIRTGLGGTRSFLANAHHRHVHGDEPPAMGEASYPYFYQEGHRVYRDVVPIVTRATRTLVERNGYKVDGIRRFWFHQASQIMLGAITKRLLGETLPTERVTVLLKNFGNTSSAGAGLCLAQDDDLETGDLACMVVFGAGYTYSGVLLRKV